MTVIFISELFHPFWVGNASLGLGMNAKFDGFFFCLYVLSYFFESFFFSFKVHDVIPWNMKQLLILHLLIFICLF